MADIKVRVLTDTQTINTDNEIMVLTNHEQNQVQNITVGNLLSNILSSDNGNVLEQGTDGKLYVETPENITGDLADLSTTDKSSLVGAINEVDSDLTAEVTNRVNAISAEATIRANADNNLQSQIDAITAASDVTDIVGTYAELQAYDTTGLSNNSIIKVLQDESRQNETTYYRWVITDGVGAWVLIGGEGPFTTVAYVDGNFATKATVGDLNNLATSDKSSVVNAMNELASVLDPTQTADYIKNSKAIYSGEVSENALILPQIQEMAHSTFDRSKFTVIGSPVITNDGIASGFSSSGTDYLTYTLSASTDSLDMYCAIIPNSVGEDIVLGGILGYLQPNYTIQFRITGYTAYLSLSSNGTSFDICNSLTGNIANLTANVLNYFRLGWNGTVYKLQHSLNKETWTDIISVNSTSPIYSATAIIGGSNKSDVVYGYFRNGSIDLKQFSNTVDGVEVFSGNKTGIDTIKPDDYTVVGTPTISADGVAGGFSASNYLYKDFSPTFVTKQKWGFELECTYNSAPDGTIDLLRVLTPTADLGWVTLRQISSGVFAFTLYDGTTSVALEFTPSSVNVGDRIKFVCKQENYSLRTMDVYVNGIKSGSTLTSTTTLDTSQSPFDTKNRLCIGGNTERTYAFTGSIDLNSIKIYVEGDFIYQPCLKIPYTESSSKFGSKIVNAIYRERVKDAYVQGYLQRYFTLDEDNGNFTLPMGELYGLIQNASRTGFLGQTVSSSAPLFDDCLHLLDGALIQGSGFYKEFMEQYIKPLLINTPSKFVTESAWQEAVNTYGVCDKFVYDSVNNTVRLPKYGNQIWTGDGTAPVKGNGMVLGLTNGTNNFGIVGNTATSNNQLYDTTKYGASITSTSPTGSVGQNGVMGVTSDGTKSGIVADLANITTALDCYYYIVVANIPNKTASVHNAGIVTEVNNKADVDLTNVSNKSGLRRLIEVSPKSILPDWYKVWEEYDYTTGELIGKWCEQGGVQTSPSQTNIPLYKSYMDINFSGQTTLRSATGATQTERNPRFGVIDESHIYISSENIGQVAQWIAYGYIN